MLPASPTSAGTSKDSKVRTKISMAKREDRRHAHPQRDRPERPQRTGAGHDSGLLERGVHRAQHGRHQQEGERNEADALDQDHAPHRVDVDGLRLLRDERDDVVDRPRASQQQEPCDGVENVRNAEREDRSEECQIAAGRVGPLHDQRLHRADHDRDDGGAEAVDDGVVEARQEETSGEQVLVEAQRECDRATRRGASRAG